MFGRNFYISVEYIKTSIVFTLLGITFFEDFTYILYNDIVLHLMGIEISWIQTEIVTQKDLSNECHLKYSQDDHTHST